MALAYSSMVLSEVRTQLELGVTDLGKVADLVERLGGERSQAEGYRARAQRLIDADRAREIEHRAGIRPEFGADARPAGRDFLRFLGFRLSKGER